jgi:hypothetical protein
MHCAYIEEPRPGRWTALCRVKGNETRDGSGGFGDRICNTVLRNHADVDEPLKSRWRRQEERKVQRRERKYKVGQVWYRS